jgi:hypothetical protein
MYRQGKVCSSFTLPIILQLTLLPVPLKKRVINGKVYSTTMNIGKGINYLPD